MSKFSFEVNFKLETSKGQVCFFPLGIRDDQFKHTWCSWEAIIKWGYPPIYSEK